MSSRLLEVLRLLLDAVDVYYHACDYHYHYARHSTGVVRVGDVSAADDLHGSEQMP